MFYLIIIYILVIGVSSRGYNIEIYTINIILADDRVPQGIYRHYIRPGLSKHHNTLRPRQNSHHFPGDIFKTIFLNKKVWLSIKISLKFVLNGPINKFPALFQIMAWRRPCDKPLSEPRMVNILTHICVTQPQWVKMFRWLFCPLLHSNSSLYVLWK